MMRNFKLLALFSLLTVLTTFDLQACHKFSLTYGRMYVSQDVISIELKIPVEDLILFRYLPVDSSRAFAINEINIAGEHYIEELRNAITISTDEGPLAIHEIRLQPFKPKGDMDQLIDVIPLTRLNEHHLSFSIKYKKPGTHQKLIIQQNFGKQYPLVPSLMVLNVDGLSDERLTCKLAKGIEQTLGNEELAAKINNQISVTHKNDTQELNFLFSASDLKNLLKIDQIDRVDAVSLTRLFEISLDGQIQDILVVDIEWINEHRGLKFKVVLEALPSQIMAIRWMKFNRQMRKFPLIINGSSETQFISRFNDSISWSIVDRGN